MRIALDQLYNLDRHIVVCVILCLNDFLIADGIDVSEIQQRCVDFGICDCNDVEDFNNILKSLGEDAEQTAYLLEDSDCEEGQGLKL